MHVLRSPPRSLSSEIPLYALAEYSWVDLINADAVSRLRADDDITAAARVPGCVIWLAVGHSENIPGDCSLGALLVKAKSALPLDPIRLVILGRAQDRIYQLCQFMRASESPRCVNRKRHGSSFPPVDACSVQMDQAAPTDLVCVPERTVMPPCACNAL